MTGLWTLVLLWSLGQRTGGHAVVIPGFSSRETCMAAVEQVTDPTVRNWHPRPGYVVCVEVK